MEMSSLTRTLTLESGPVKLTENAVASGVFESAKTEDSNGHEDPTSQELHDDEQQLAQPQLHYHCLNPKNREFRILTILDHEEDHPVRCTLEKTSLFPFPGSVFGANRPSVTYKPYAALSYCWGDPSITVPIFVNQCLIQVTTNLEAALRQLRLRGYHRVWIDALCINQEDRKERGLQVQIMRDIYSRADHVISWVGVADDDRAEGVKYLLERSSSIPDTFADGNDEFGLEESSEPSTPQWISDERFRKLHQDKAVLGSSPRYSRLEKAKRRWIRNQWSIIQEFFNQDYWKRIWVIQEVAVATQLKVLYGRSEIDWEHVSIAIVIWKKTLMALPTSHLSHLYAAQLLDLRNRFKAAQEPIKLLDAMLMSRKAMSTDPRDKIFALIGLTTDGSMVVPTPSYQRSLGDILRDMIRAMIIVERSLDVIFIRSLYPQEDYTIPSWVPPWLTTTAFSYWSKPMTILEDHLLAHRARFPHIPISKTTTPHTLKVQGIILDKILALSSALGHKTNPLLNGCSLEQCDNQLECQCNINIFYPSGPTNALWQSLCLEHTFHPFRDDGKSYDKGHVITLRSCFASLWLHERKGICSAELVDWLEENASMKIGRLTLEEWAKEAVSTSQRQHTDSDFRRFCDTLSAVLKTSLRLFVTRIGYVGMAHPQARKDDRVAYLKGCSVPVILRGSLEKGYQVVGCCYVRIRFEPYGEACKRFAMGKEHLDDEPPLDIRELQLI